jgi:sensor histidine kinase regulating citrate/malate metabolism
VEAVMRDQRLKRVDLRFMDHENWIVTEYTNASVGERGPELQFRRVRIFQNGVQEDGGEKTITYLPKELQ